MGDLYASSSRVFKELPDDLLENVPCCTDVLILLHSSFLLLTVEGFHQLKKVLIGEDEAICFGLSEEKCILDSVALGKSLQLKHSNKEISLRDSIKALGVDDQTPSMDIDASISQVSLVGLKVSHLKNRKSFL